MTIVLTNCKGYGSKEESIKKDIVEQLSPQIILLNETLLTGSRKINQKNIWSSVKTGRKRVLIRRRGGRRGQPWCPNSYKPAQ